MRDEPPSPAQRIAAECLAVRLRTLNRKLTRIYDDAMRPHGLTTAQVNVLVAIASVGHVAPGDLGEALGLEKSTLSRGLKRLAEHGLIEQWAARAGRGQLLTISEAGAARLAELLPDWERAQGEAAELLGPELEPAIASLVLGPR